MMRHEILNSARDCSAMLLMLYKLLLHVVLGDECCDAECSWVMISMMIPPCSFPNVPEQGHVGTSCCELSEELFEFHVDGACPSLAVDNSNRPHHDHHH